MITNRETNELSQILGRIDGFFKKIIISNITFSIIIIYN